MEDKKYKIAEADMRPTESVQQFYTVEAPAGTPREAPLDPGFWVHVSRWLAPMAEIRVMPRDGMWYGRYICLFADPNQAKVKELEFHQLQSVEQGVPDSDMIPKFVSPPLRWCVIRKSDNKRLVEKLQNKEDAVLWISRNAKKMAA